MPTDWRDPGRTVLTVTWQRWRATRAFALVGSAAIVAGGLLAAITRPTGLEHGSWAAAYLVLVVGVAQLVLGIGQAALTPEPPSARLRTWQLVLYDAGNAAVLVGVLAEVPAVVLAGGALLFAALALFLVGVRGTPATVWVVLYLLMTAVLAVSIPIGLVLSVQV